MKELEKPKDNPHKEHEDPPGYEVVSDFLEHSKLELAALGGEGTEVSDIESYRSVSEEDEGNHSEPKKPGDSNGKSIQEEIANV